MMYQLLHDRAAAEALDVVLKALDASRRHLRHFVGVVDAGKAPANVHARELGHKLPAGLHIAEVDKPIADVAPILEVNRQVQEIKLPSEVSVQLVDQHVTRVLVGNVPQHHRGVLDALVPAPAAAAAAAELLLQPRGLPGLAPPALPGLAAPVPEGAAAPGALLLARGRRGGRLALHDLRRGLALHNLSQHLLLLGLRGRQLRCLLGRPLLGGRPLRGLRGCPVGRVRGHPAVRDLLCHCLVLGLPNLLLGNWPSCQLRARWGIQLRVLSGAPLMLVLLVLAGGPLRQRLQQQLCLNAGCGSRVLLQQALLAHSKTWMQKEVAGLVVRHRWDENPWNALLVVPWHRQATSASHPQFKGRQVAHAWRQQGGVHHGRRCGRHVGARSAGDVGGAAFGPTLQDAVIVCLGGNRVIPTLALGSLAFLRRAQDRGLAALRLARWR
mmetsp:Transcript_29935/g.85811  ORF Transcript_29935/g.85811 Transcript_29935/m.85811 type:complete len:440 (-) Transcript_29935:148-1467(-)